MLRRAPARPDLSSAAFGHARTDTVLVDLYRLLPLEGVKILLVLLPSFVTGSEREACKTGTDRYSFGDVRTLPLIGLIG